MNEPQPTGEGPDIATRRAALVEAALVHVPFDGMNARALAAAAAELGIDPVLAGVLVPGGGAGLAAAYHRRADAQLAEWLAKSPPEGRFRDRIAAAVVQRLRLVDRELVRAGAATLALPAHAALAARLMAETADVIWSGLGDASQDVNWWTKRGILASVIAATVLYWLGDDSADMADTRAFLDRRIEGVMRFEKARAQLARVPGMAGLTRAATGWITAPVPRDLPGGRRPHRNSI